MNSTIERHCRKFQRHVQQQHRKHGTVPVMAQVNYGFEEDRYYPNPGETFEAFASFIRSTAAKYGSWLALVSRPFDPATDLAWEADRAFLLEIYPHEEIETPFPALRGMQESN